MPPLKLTKARVEGIKAPDPSGKQTIVWDLELKGFGVLISGTTTRKSYVVQRRMPDGRTRRLTVGAVGEFKRVEDAREKAGTLLLGLREGRDPKSERRAAAARDRTLRRWLDSYLATNQALRPRSVEEYRRAEKRLAAWMDRPLREITPDMVEEKHAAIGRDAGPASANGAMRTLRVVWNHALDRDASLPANPVRRLKKGWFDLKPRTGMVRPDDLPRFYEAIRAVPNQTAADYLTLVLFTGLRRREAAALRWEEVDFATRVIRMPAARAKADRKLDLPMSSFVRNLLVARRALGDDGGWVFPANSRSGYIEEPGNQLDQIGEATGIRVTPHDLRRTFVTVAESCDVSVYALKAMVNHALGTGVTEGYVQMTTERLREAVERVSDKMKLLCRINAPAGDNVARVG
jgi:integrase